MKDHFFSPFDSGAQFSPQGSRNSPQKAFRRPGSLAGERLVDCRHLARFAAEASPGNNKGLGGCLVVWTTNRGWEQLQLGHISIFRRAPVIPSSSSITCRCNGRMSYCHIVTTPTMRVTISITKKYYLNVSICLCLYQMEWRCIEVRPTLNHSDPQRVRPLGILCKPEQHGRLAYFQDVTTCMGHSTRFAHDIRRITFLPLFVRFDCSLRNAR